MKNYAFLILCLTIGFCFSAVAVEESEFAESARTRQYKGGADEDDLKVQQLKSKDDKNKKSNNEEANEGF